MIIDEQANAQAVEELIAITTSLSTERDITRLLNMIVSSARRLTHAEVGCVHILDKTKRRLMPEVYQNDRVEVAAPELPTVSLFLDDRRNTRNIGAYCAFSGKLVNIEDVYRYTGFDFQDLYDFDRRCGYKTRSVLAVPLRNHLNVTIGILQLMNRRDEASGALAPFPQAVEGIVRAFASQAAVALNNVQLIEQNRRLIEILDATNRDLERENQLLRERIRGRYEFSQIVGSSPAMQAVFDLMSRVLDTDATVLLNGETGTGKEMIARAIHHNCKRRDHEFVAQNCAALPENLLESELFGYLRGAFSGADKDKQGLIELAHNGTLFLDEIGDMPLALQSKLLRVLQESEVRPLGALEARRVNVRVIAATHCDLKEKIRDGSFREDLYYRLCVFPIELPPLRNRSEDIPVLLQHFLDQSAERFSKTVAGVSPRAFERFQNHDYPGNVRELRNLIERAVLMVEDGGTITPEHLSVELKRSAEKSPQPLEVDVGPVDLKDTVGRYEAAIIERKLAHLNGNQTRAAEELGISRRTLIEKMHKYNIRRPANRPRADA